jgi:hypothetical protein
VGRHVFISYVREDSEPVDRLVDELRQHGIEVWLDRDSIAPGERWREVIVKAIRAGDLFIACFSRDYLERDRTYMNDELTLAIDELRMRSTDRSWFIPVSLDGVGIPRRAISGSETLHDLQSVNLCENWLAGVTQIVAVAHAKASPTVEPRGTLTSRRSETITERALRIDHLRIATERSRNFLWSSAGVNSAREEVENLHATLVTRANELSVLTFSLNIEAEISFPSCVVRLRDRTIMAYWHQDVPNEVESARLYILEYGFRYHFSLPSRVKEFNTRAEFQFVAMDIGNGWSSGREVVTSNDVVDTCFDMLLAGIDEKP